MANLAYLTAIPRSFYSPGLYKEVVSEWKGRGLLYLMMITYILSAASIINIALSIQISTKEYLYNLLKQAPEIEIKNGQVYTNIEQPIFLKDKVGKVRATIDITGKYQKISEETGWLLLTKNSLHLQGRNGEGRIFEFPEDMNYIVNKKNLDKDILKRISIILLAAPIVALFILLPFYFLALISICILGIIGLIVSKIFRCGIKYQEIFKLVSVASTPLVILIVVRIISDIQFPGWIYFILAITYTCFAVISAKGEQI